MRTLTSVETDMVAGGGGPDGSKLIIGSICSLFLGFIGGIGFRQGLGNNKRLELVIQNKLLMTRVDTLTNERDILKKENEAFKERERIDKENFGI